MILIQEIRKTQMKTPPRRQRGILLSPQGWKRLQDARREAEIQENSGERYTLEKLSERTGLDFSTVAKVLEREVGVDKRTLERFFSAFNLELDKSDYFKLDPNSQEREKAIPPMQVATPFKETALTKIASTRQDLLQAVESGVFYGRTEELNTLLQWLLDKRCRLIALLGMGGIGKTALAAKFVEQTKENFEYVQWRSLLQALPVHEILANLIHFLSNGQ